MILNSTSITHCLLPPTAYRLAGFRPVTQLYFSDITSDSLTVAWGAPAPPADTFVLSYTTEDFRHSSQVTLDGSKTRTTFRDLLPSRKYIITLVTVRGDVTETVEGTVVTGRRLLHVLQVLLLVAGCVKAVYKYLQATRVGYPRQASCVYRIRNSCCCLSHHSLEIIQRNKNQPREHTGDKKLFSIYLLKYLLTLIEHGPVNIYKYNRVNMM